MFWLNIICSTYLICHSSFKVLATRKCLHQQKQKILTNFGVFCIDRIFHRSIFVYVSVFNLFLCILFVPLFCNIFVKLTKSIFTTDFVKTKTQRTQLAGNMVIFGSDFTTIAPKYSTVVLTPSTNTNNIDVLLLHCFKLNICSTTLKTLIKDV